MTDPGDIRSRLVPPSSASWWAITATVRCTRSSLTGLIRVQFQDGAGPQTNRAVFSTTYPRQFGTPHHVPELLTETVDAWYEYHDILRSWKL